MSARHILSWVSKNRQLLLMLLLWKQS